MSKNQTSAASGAASGSQPSRGFFGKPPLGFWNFGTGQSCYINRCGRCKRYFMAVSKHLPACRDCNGNPEFIYANPTRLQPDLRGFFPGYPDKPGYYTARHDNGGDREWKAEVKEGSDGELWALMECNIQTFRVKELKENGWHSFRPAQPENNPA